MSNDRWDWRAKTVLVVWALIFAVTTVLIICALTQVLVGASPQCEASDIVGILFPLGVWFLSGGIVGALLCDNAAPIQPLFHWLLCLGMGLIFLTGMWGAYMRFFH